MSRDKAGQAGRRQLFPYLYPFVTAAVAINLFMLGLAGEYMGLPSFSPVWALTASVPIGFPATWLTSRWVRKLLAEAEN